MPSSPPSPGDKGRGPEVVRSRQGSSGGVDQWGQRVAGPCWGRGGGGGSGEDTVRGKKQAAVGGGACEPRGGSRRRSRATGVSCSQRAEETARPRDPSSAPGKWPPSSRPCRSVRTPSPSPWRAGPAAHVPSAVRRVRPCRSAPQGPPPAATAAPASRAAASACQAGSRKYAPRLAVSSTLFTEGPIK